MADQGEITKYLISRLVDMESSFGKTKLVKLLYLIDLEYYRSVGRTLTGFNWVFYHYGPYAFEIDALLDSLKIDIPQEDTKTKDGHNARIFKPTRELESTIKPGLEKSIIDRVINSWGLEELNTLLNHVYFHTEPMDQVQRGATLDFSVVKRTHLVAASKQSTSVSPKVAEELRKKLRESLQSRPHVMNLEPKPRFDQSFWDAVTNMYVEEQTSIQPGDAEVSQNVKTDIRAGRQSRHELSSLVDKYYEQIKLGEAKLLHKGAFGWAPAFYLPETLTTLELTYYDPKNEFHNRYVVAKPGANVLFNHTPVHELHLENNEELLVVKAKRRKFLVLCGAPDYGGADAARLCQKCCLGIPLWTFHSTDSERFKASLKALEYPWWIYLPEDKTVGMQDGFLRLDRSQIIPEGLLEALPVKLTQDAFNLVSEWSRFYSTGQIDPVFMLDRAESITTLKGEGSP